MGWKSKGVGWGASSGDALKRLLKYCDWAIIPGRTDEGRTITPLPKNTLPNGIENEPYLQNVGVMVIQRSQLGNMLTSYSGVDFIRVVGTIPNQKTWTTATDGNCLIEGMTEVTAAEVGNFSTLNKFYTTTDQLWLPIPKGESLEDAKNRWENTTIHYQLTTPIDILNNPARSIITDLAGKGGTNLFDKQSITAGKAVSGIDGTLITVSGSNTSDYIKCDGLTNVYAKPIGASSAYGMAFFDQNKKFISGIKYETGHTERAMPIPATAVYLRTWVKDADLDTFMLNIGNSGVPFTPYGKANVLMKNQANTKDSGLRVTGKPNGGNLIDLYSYSPGVNKTHLANQIALSQTRLRVVNTVGGVDWYRGSLVINLKPNTGYVLSAVPVNYEGDVFSTIVLKNSANANQVSTFSTSGVNAIDVEDVAAIPTLDNTRLKENFITEADGIVEVLLYVSGYARNGKGFVDYELHLREGEEHTHAISIAPSECRPIISRKGDGMDDYGILPANAPNPVGLQDFAFGFVFKTDVSIQDYEYVYSRNNLGGADDQQFAVCLQPSAVNILVERLARIGFPIEKNKLYKLLIKRESGMLQATLNDITSTIDCNVIIQEKPNSKIMARSNSSGFLWPAQVSLHAALYNNGLSISEFKKWFNNMCAEEFSL